LHGRDLKNQESLQGRTNESLGQFYGTGRHCRSPWCDWVAKWNVRIGLSWLAWGCIKLPHRLLQNPWILYPTYP